MPSRAAWDVAAAARGGLLALARATLPLTTAFLLASCGSGPAPSTSAAAPHPAGHATVRAGPMQTVPADFPTDVHLPAAGFTILNFTRSPTSIVLTVHASPPRGALYAEYDAAMKAAGWTQAMAVQPSSAESVMTYRKGVRVVTISLATRVGGSDAGTDVGLQLTRESSGH